MTDIGHAPRAGSSGAGLAARRRPRPRRSSASSSLVGARSSSGSSASSRTPRRRRLVVLGSSAVVLVVHGRRRPRRPSSSSATSSSAVLAVVGLVLRRPRSSPSAPAPACSSSRASSWVLTTSLSRISPRQPSISSGAGSRLVIDVPAEVLELQPGATTLRPPDVAGALEQALRVVLQHQQDAGEVRAELVEGDRAVHVALGSRRPPHDVLSRAPARRSSPPRCGGTRRPAPSSWSSRRQPARRSRPSS